MNAALAIVAGAGFGLGLVMAVRAVWPGPVPLATVLSDLQRPATPSGDPGPAVGLSSGWGRLRRWSVRVMEVSGLMEGDDLRRMLRVAGTSVEEHAFGKVTAAATGFVAPVAVAVVVSLAGVAVPVVGVILAAVGLAAAGFVWPDLRLRERVEQRRQGFRHALSAYLDLVTIILAGGGGLETALQVAADSGGGWAFAELRHALHRSRVTGRTPWDVFADLGDELGIEELAELAAAAHLAGDQGARIRASLAAKADTMRARETAAIESQAETATEKMLLPVVGLVVGMILFVGFGVVEAISTPDPTSLTPP